LLTPLAPIGNFLGSLQLPPSRGQVHLQRQIMPKHPTSARVPRPDPEPDDKFIFAVERTAIWARENSRQLIIGGIVLAVLVLAAVYYLDSRRRVEAEAATRLAEVQQTVMTGNIPLATRDLQAYLATFGDTRAAREARILLADLLLAQDRPGEAIDALGRLPRNVDEPLGLAAAQILAAAYEAQGQYDDSIQTYERIARNARFDFQRREALADAGRVALDTGRPDLAADFYDRLVDTFEEGDPGRGYYEMWRAEARARAARNVEVPASPPAAAPDSPAATD
jgi:predicted negative regulator of RcsB-dependent stress response